MATATQERTRVSTSERMHVPRSRGAVSGVMLVILGAWGGLIPFVGPYFDFAYTPDNAWNFTWGRFWLEILPAIAVVLGGLAVLGTTNRVNGWVGAWLAAAGGAWFVIGQQVSQLWTGGDQAAGYPVATSSLGQVLEQLAFFTGLGAVIIFFAAAALGRMSVVGVRDLPQRRTEREVGDRRTDEHDVHRERRERREHAEHMEPLEHREQRHVGD